jgi:hypothetical protein
MIVDRYCTGSCRTIGKAFDGTVWESGSSEGNGQGDK